MAKVTINVEKAAHVNTAKNVDYLEWPAMGKFAITLLNRPRYWSYFNTPLFQMNHTPRQFKFYSDIFADDQSRYRCTTICEGATAPESYGGETYTAASQHEADLKRYRYTFYVPELLLPKHPLDGEPNGGQAYDRLNAVMLAFSAPNQGFWKKSSDALFDKYPAATESRNFYPYADQAEFEAKLNETKAFNLGTADLTERNDNTDNPRLPNPQWYSKFSILRNRHYEYTIREKDRLQVEMRIAPWEEEKSLGESLMFNWVQVNVADPTFSSTNKETRLRIQNDLKTTDQTYEWATITLLDQDGKPNTQAYFKDYGNMRKVNASGNANKLQFGSIGQHNNEQGFADFTVNWSNASGKNLPAAGKTFIRIEYFKSDRGQVVPATNRLGEKSSDIVVRSANWRDTYDSLLN